MIEELLEIMLGGAQGQAAQQPQRQPAANPWMDILEGVLGGGAQAPQKSQSGMGMGDILEAVLGGGAGGGQRGQVGSNPMLAPFTQLLAERLGISPQMASVIISAAFGLLVSNMRGAAQSGQVDPQAGLAGLDLDHLLDKNVLASQGVTTRVARQTGMSESDVERSLREALEILGVRPSSSAAPAQPKKSAPIQQSAKKSSAKASNLEHLLDTWQIDG